MNQARETYSHPAVRIPGWKALARQPAPVLAALGAVSGLLSAYIPGPAALIDAGGPPQFGIYMALAGIWFGLVIGFGLWRSGHRSAIALATAVLTTWIGWELAVNIAMQIAGPAGPDAVSAYYVAGMISGAVGALLTYAAASPWVPAFRRLWPGAQMTAAGAILGLLLPWATGDDLPIVLFVPWQAALAGLFGWHIATLNLRRE